MIFAQVFIFFDSLQSLIKINKVSGRLINDIINLYPSSNIRRMILRNSINEDVINIDIFNSSFSLETITSLILDNRIYSNGSFFVCILLDDESYDEKTTDRYDESRKLFPIGLVMTPLVVPALTYTDFATAPSRAPNNELYFISMNAGSYVSPIYEIESAYYNELDEDAPYPLSLIDNNGKTVYDSPSISNPILTSIEDFYNENLVFAQLFTKSLCSSLTRLRIFGKNLKIKIDGYVFSIEGYLNIKCKPNINQPNNYYIIENSNIEDLQISINKEKFNYETPIIFESDNIIEYNANENLNIQVKNDINKAYKLFVRIPNPIATFSPFGIFLKIDEKNFCFHASVRPNRIAFNEKIDNNWQSESSVNINCTNEMIIFIDTLEDCWLIYIDNGIDKVYATRKFSSLGYKFLTYSVDNNNNPAIKDINLIYYNKKLEIDNHIDSRNPLIYSTIGIDYKIWDISFFWDQFRDMVELFFIIDGDDLENTDIIFSLTISYDDYKDTYVNTVLTRINGNIQKVVFSFNKDDQIKAKVYNEFKIMMVQNSASIVVNKNVYYFNLNENCNVNNIKKLVWKKNIDNQSFSLKETSFDYGQLGAIWGYYSLPIHRYSDFKYVDSKYLLPVKSPQFLCENIDWNINNFLDYMVVDKFFMGKVYDWSTNPPTLKDDKYSVSYEVLSKYNYFIDRDFNGEFKNILIYGDDNSYKTFELYKYNHIININDIKYLSIKDISNLNIKETDKIYVATMCIGDDFNYILANNLNALNTENRYIPRNFNSNVDDLTQQKIQFIEDKEELSLIDAIIEQKSILIRKDYYEIGDQLLQRSSDYSDIIILTVPSFSQYFPSYNKYVIPYEDNFLEIEIPGIQKKGLKKGYTLKIINSEEKSNIIENNNEKYYRIIINRYDNYKFYLSIDLTKLNIPMEFIKYYNYISISGKLSSLSGNVPLEIKTNLGTTLSGSEDVTTTYNSNRKSKSEIACQILDRPNKLIIITLPILDLENSLKNIDINKNYIKENYFNYNLELILKINYFS